AVVHQPCSATGSDRSQATTRRIVGPVSPRPGVVASSAHAGRASRAGTVLPDTPGLFGSHGAIGPGSGVFHLVHENGGDEYDRGQQDDQDHGDDGDAHRAPRFTLVTLTTSVPTVTPRCWSSMHHAAAVSGEFDEVGPGLPRDRQNGPPLSARSTKRAAACREIDETGRAPHAIAPVRPSHRTRHPTSSTSPTDWADDVHTGLKRKGAGRHEFRRTRPRGYVG